MVFSFFSGDVWALVFLGLMLKLPLIGIGVALWMAFKRTDAARPELTPLQSRMALCAYCGTRITVGYDADVLHEQAHRIGTRTGEAVFEVESRLVRQALRQSNHYASEPRYCPGCGDEAAWTPIEPIDLSAAGRPRLGQTG
ncbi:MAG: hypothetical protein ABJB93_07835 [Gaiellales bacterium]